MHEKNKRKKTSQRCLIVSLEEKNGPVKFHTLDWLFIIYLHAWADANLKLNILLQMSDVIVKPR